MEENKKKRGILLTLWLILLIIFGLIPLFVNLLIIVFPPSLLEIPFYSYFIYLFISLANLIFFIFLFKWKKWAFFAFCGSAVIAFIMNLAIGLGIFAIFGLAGLVILYLIMRPKWDLFE